MKFYDFEYDGVLLSDLGYTICNFGSNGLNTVSNGSQITFNTISTLNGAKHELSSSEYSNCLEASFQICKNPCESNSDLLEIDNYDFRQLVKWLNRKEFHKLKFFEDGYLNIYFEGSFNISRVENDGKLVGLELNLITNRPFALSEPKKIVVKNFVNNGTKIILDSSDEEGFIYPDMTITVNQSGTLSIHNSIEDRTMEIKNCVVGEVIKINYPMISSSISSHKIQDDFNWSFFRIANTYKNNQNKLTISIPCTIEIKYSPIVKLGI